MLLNETWTMNSQWRILQLEENIPPNIEITVSALTLLPPFISPATDLEGRKALQKLQLFQTLPILPLYLGSPRLTQAWGWSWRYQDKLTWCRSCQFTEYAMKLMNQYSFVPNYPKKARSGAPSSATVGKYITLLHGCNAQPTNVCQTVVCPAFFQPAAEWCGAGKAAVLCPNHCTHPCYPVKPSGCLSALVTVRQRFFHPPLCGLKVKPDGNGRFIHPNTRLPLDLLLCPLHFLVILPLIYLTLSPSAPSFPPSHLKPPSPQAATALSTRSLLAELVHGSVITHIQTSG